MEPLRTVMFIDGRNFKYNLQAFQFYPLEESKENEGHYYSLDEKHFLWQGFFSGIIQKFNKSTTYEHRLIRVYWYNAGTMRPFVAKEGLVQAILAKYCAKFPDLDENKVIFLAKEWYDRERQYFDVAKEKIYEKLQRKINFLEFKYTGEYVVLPFKVHKFEKGKNGEFFYQGTREGEKGVDVGITVDMIAKMPNYDAAVLVSGDADFLPVVRYLKDNLKYVYQFSIAKSIPPEIKYLSPWLIGVVDVFEFFDEIELLENYLNRKSGIPPPILDAIDNRIKELKDLQTHQQNRGASPVTHLD